MIGRSRPASYSTAVVPCRPEGAGPYRYRRWRPAGHYATVTVVDGDGWAHDHSGASDPAALVEPSQAIVHALALRFGAVTWGFAGRGSSRGGPGGGLSARVGAWARISISDRPAHCWPRSCR